MQRYYVEQEQVDLAQNRIALRGEEWHHIAKVMRFRVGERFWCFDGSGMEYLAQLAEIFPQGGSASIVFSQPGAREPIHRVTLAQGLPKGDKMDWVIQKNTELGAFAFLPFSSERTVVKLSADKVEKRQERWQRIARESAEQSQRSRVPEVHLPLSWDQLLARAGDYDMTLLAYEGEAVPMRRVLEAHQSFGTLLFAVGPEGGFSPQEVEQAKATGFLPVSLGKRILRSETAGLVGLSALFYHFDE